MKTRVYIKEEGKIYKITTYKEEVTLEEIEQIKTSLEDKKTANIAASDIQIQELSTQIAAIKDLEEPEKQYKYEN